MQTKTLLYDSFNAKYLSFKEVADTFIPNSEYYQLQSNTSMLLMGPRGCGKTTLLKMLTVAGLKYWNCQESEKIRNSLGFIAIYIPSDIQWKNQLDYLNSNLKGEDKFKETITQFLFATNIQIAICRTFSSLVYFEEYSEQEKLNIEYSICKELIDIWSIKGISSAQFDKIEIQLIKRVDEVNKIVKQIIFNKSEGNLFKSLPEYTFSDFFDLVKLGCKAFEILQPKYKNVKWALCFDELEIAPKFIQLRLMTFLRSVDQNFLFKLTTTPLFVLDNNIVEATQGNDFSTIKLWVYDDMGLKKWQEFCYNLITNRLIRQAKFDKTSSLEKIFSKYSLDEIIKNELDDLNNPTKKALDYHGSFQPGTGKGSSLNFLFKYLANNDKSFYKFLCERGISASDPIAINPTISKSVFLKYKIDTVYRKIFRNRTRRTPTIHYGLPYIFDICDGNPRLVIGLVDDIISRSTINISNEEISKSEQTQIILDASRKYHNQLKNHPDSTIVINQNEFNLALDLLDPIGNYIHDKIIQEEFSKTSPSTFRVDVGINHKLLQLLETALYLGAIVYLDPIESLSNTGLIGKRFRLSSFLTPKYKIPNRSFSEVQLSTILRIEKDKLQKKIEYENDKN